jgi:hypothetical protein
MVFQFNAFQNLKEEKKSKFKNMLQIPCMGFELERTQLDLFEG